MTINPFHRNTETDKTSTFVVDRKFPHPDNLRLSTHALSVYIGGNPILKLVNVEIPKNKITCIIGPSGCGKTTLLRTFNRLVDTIEGVKLEGVVMLGDHDIVRAGATEITEIRRLIGLVPQRPCPLPMSIYENIAYGCRIHGISGRKKLDAIVEYYLRAVGLWDEVRDRLHTPASKLSGGQQQRLCLARSLAIEPSYLLADESTSALDPISSRTVEELFVKLKKDYSIVMVTHTLRQARRIADHVIFMYLGEVIEEGDADQVFNHPRHELTQQYLGGAFS
ncbi:MAG: phosphate ABC transporter ATP-binding protein [Bacteroidaceae bacterium]|nr:phosphate ABC transporter ATP-binding protein [Bacteroidaceae bacterium]